MDYYVGLPPGTVLADPTTAQLPGGCTVRDSTGISCSKSNVTVSGYDFSLHGGLQLEFESGTSNITVEGNRFGVGTKCTTPLSFAEASGQVSVLHNSFDGAGALCANGLDLGALVSGYYDDKSTLTVEYNVFANAPEDVTDNGGATTGAAAIIERYNLIWMAGWMGHPDAFQANGGNFDPIDLSCNTVYNANPPAVGGLQPLHVEAQLGAAINDASVAYNTIVTPGSCDMGQNYSPANCPENSDIACKQDPPPGTNTNTNFAAFGNYIDWTGAIGPLDDGAACPSTTWGSPAPNIDLSTGQALPVPSTM